MSVIARNQAKVRRTVNMVPHSLYNKVCDEGVEAAKEIVRLEAQLTGAVEALAKVRDYCAGMLAAFEADDGYWNDLPRAEELLRDVLNRAEGQ